MSEPTYNDRLITEYILGSLSPAETERLDEMSFTDDAFSARLQFVENDLVDAYVRGELQGKALRQFESSYMSSPVRRERVEFAEIFLKLADSASRRRRVRAVWWKPGFSRMRGWVPLAAAASLLVALGGLVVQDFRLTQQRNDLRTESQTLRERASELQSRVEQQRVTGGEQQKQIDELRQSIARLETPAGITEPHIVPVRLEAQTRGPARIPSVSVSPEADFVTFQLESDAEDNGRYQAALKHAPGGEIVWRRDGLGIQRREGQSAFVISIRAGLLKPGEYVWTVSALRARQAPEVTGVYAFRVERNTVP